MAEKLTVSQVAAQFGVHPQTVRRWADEGLIPASRTLGGARRFDAADVARARQDGLT